MISENIMVKKEALKKALKEKKSRPTAEGRFVLTMFILDENNSEELRMDAARILIFGVKQ